ncbi:MAG: DUF3343 domain-containing protein [Ruminococcaceae bacterium]|nr:DUF3343 domain-containing protein [Oscillospiraceae bacterium]
MKKCIIAISSVNHAIRAEKYLSSNNLKVRIVKLQPNTTKKGCAYGLELNCKDINSAVSFLDNAAIPYSEIVR